MIFRKFSWKFFDKRIKYLKVICKIHLSCLFFKCPQLYENVDREDLREEMRNMWVYQSCDKSNNPLNIGIWTELNWLAQWWAVFDKKFCCMRAQQFWRVPSCRDTMAIAMRDTQTWKHEILSFCGDEPLVNGVFIHTFFSQMLRFSFLSP